MHLQFQAQWPETNSILCCSHSEFQMLLRHEPTRTGPNRPNPTCSDPVRPCGSAGDQSMFAAFCTAASQPQRPAEIRLAAKWRWVSCNRCSNSNFGQAIKKGRSIHFRHLLSHTHIYVAGAVDPLQPYIIATSLHSACHLHSFIPRSAAGMPQLRFPWLFSLN